MVRFKRKEPPPPTVTRSNVPKSENPSVFSKVLNKVLPRRFAREPIERSFRIIRPPGAATTATTTTATIALDSVASQPSKPAFLDLFSGGSEKMKVLEESRNYVPRYLFRACWPNSGGGLKGLNTEEGIFPHAYVDGNGHNSIHDMSQSTVRAMANGHLRGQRPPRTDPTYSEFSSWAASLSLVLQYGYSWAQHGGLICVLDRYNLPKHTKVYHCPSLNKAGLCDGPYCHEYLVHGPVKGPGFKAVPVKTLFELGLYTEITVVQPGSRYWWGPIQNWDWEKSFKAEAIDEKKIKRLRKIAKEFGPNFELAMTAAFTTLERRAVDSKGAFGEKDIRAFYNAVSDLDIPEEFGQGPGSIIQDGVYVTGYPMVSQLVELMRGLVEYTYGKGARTRQKREALKKTEVVSVAGSSKNTEAGCNRVSIQIYGVDQTILDAVVY